MEQGKRFEKKPLFQATLLAESFFLFSFPFSPFPLFPPHTHLPQML